MDVAGKHRPPSLERTHRPYIAFQNQPALLHHLRHRNCGQLAMGIGFSHVERAVKFVIRVPLNTYPATRATITLN